MVVREWIASRDPEIPEALARWLTVALGGDDAPAPDTAGLVRAACVEMDAAMPPHGVAREAAYRLLTADGLLTHACQAALDGEDPEVALGRLLIPFAAAGDRVEDSG